MYETILSLAQSLTGAAEDEQALLGLLCAAAEREWTERLREGVAPEDCGDAFPCAAAFTAAADLLVGRGGGSTAASFTAGTVSVRERGAAESNSAAAALRELAVRLMAPYAAEDGFCFRGVKA